MKILYNTEVMKKNKLSNDDSSSVLQEYREEIEQLRLENENLREENYKLKQN